jgi:hypothetical protein
MTTRGSLARRALGLAAGLAAALAGAATVRAEIVAYENDTWRLTFDGRTSAFYSYEWGDAQPHFTVAQIQQNGGVPPAMTGNLVWTSFTDTSNQDRGMCLASGTANGEVCSFTTSRVHSGFVGNFFGFTVRKKVADGLTATGRIALWWPVETDRYRGYSSMSPDPRESYAKLEGRWGGLLAGRALGLHDRGGTLIDFLYVDGNAVGSPCSANGQGPLCGFIGYGYQFPGFNAAIAYNTPVLGGFQLTAGIYDPAVIGQSTATLDILPVPRFESEATYTFKSSSLAVILFVNGMWQKASGFVTNDAGTTEKITRNAGGASYGGRVETGVFKVGVVGNYDVGGGDTSGLVGSVPIDDVGNLRTVTGYMGQAMLTLGPVDLAGGAGITMVQQTDNDIAHQNSVIKDRFGASGTLAYHVGPTVTFVGQFFHAEHVFWRGQMQMLNFVHAGMSFVW